jgi:cell division septal protein FtsQ
VIALASVLALGLLAWGVSISPLLAIDSITVRGEGHVTTAQVIAASGVHHGDAMVWLHPSRAAAGIERLPWVRHASVRRDWPRTVRIVVTERNVVAWVPGLGTAGVLVSGDGHVVAATATPPSGLPALAGLTRLPAIGGTIAPASAARVAAGLADLRGAVASVSVVHGDVTLSLGDGPEVRMGEPRDVAAKIRAAVAVQHALTTAVSYIDVTVPSNPVAG